MKFHIAITTSRELSDYHSEAIHLFEKMLSKGLLDLKSDWVEEVSMALTCVSPVFSKFHKPKRPKYYADRTLKCPASITPEIRLYKCFMFDFMLDFETYIQATNQEECLNLLSRSFVAFLEELKYPGALKQFEKEKFLQRVKSILALTPAPCSFPT